MELASNGNNHNVDEYWIDLFTSSDVDAQENQSVYAILKDAKEYLVFTFGKATPGRSRAAILRVNSFIHTRQSSTR